MSTSGKLTHDEQKLMEQLAEAVANELADGKSKGDITKDLMKEGFSEQLAAKFVDRIEEALTQQFKDSPEGRQVMASKYKRHMLYGILWAAGGTAVTVATLEAVSPVFIVAWGAIVFGIIDFFRGLVGWLKYKD